MVMCLGQGVDLHVVQLMPLSLTVSCSSESRLVPAQPGSPGQIHEGRKTVVCMCVCVLAVVVCLSICLSHAGIVSKQLNVESWKQRHTIVQGL